MTHVLTQILSLTEFVPSFWLAIIPTIDKNLHRISHEIPQSSSFSINSQHIFVRFLGKLNLRVPI